MAYEPKNNTGSLFVNDRKETNNHPDYSGSILVDGKEFWLSGWKKPGKGGKGPWLSLSVKPKDGRQGAPQRGRQALENEADRAFDLGRKPAARSMAEELDEDIPF